MLFEVVFHNFSPFVMGLGFQFLWDVFENFGRFGRFEKVVVPLNTLNTLNPLNTYFLSVKESNKEKLFSFQILPLFEARCSYSACLRTRLRRDKQPLADGWA